MSILACDRTEVRSSAPEDANRRNISSLPNRSRGDSRLSAGDAGQQIWTVSKVSNGWSTVSTSYDPVGNCSLKTQLVTAYEVWHPPCLSHSRTAPARSLI